MIRWHHRLNGHESERTPGDSEGQGSLACCSLWDHKESDMTEQQQHEQNLRQRMLLVVLLNKKCGAFSSRKGCDF